jgi:hypothetical protein
VVATIGVSQARRLALQTANQPIPNVVVVQAELDTGASSTCVDPSVLTKLNLVATGTTQVNTPTTGSRPVSADTFDISLSIAAMAGLPSFVLNTIPIIQSELSAAQGIEALIGRDVLKFCLLTYDGRNELFSLAY